MLHIVSTDPLSIFDSLQLLLQKQQILFGGICKDNFICGRISGCTPHVTDSDKCRCGKNVKPCTESIRKQIQLWLSSNSTIQQCYISDLHDEEYIYDQDCPYSHSSTIMK